MTERDKGPERPHPGRVVFEKMGVPSLIGEERPYHGRIITAEDYFLQPDLHPRAQAMFRAAITIKPDDPNFPAFQQQFLSFANHYFGGQADAQP